MVRDPRHVDHEKLREAVADRPPGQRTVEINGQRYQLLTLHEWLSSPNATVTRWEVFELVALVDQRKRYESRWARAWRAVIRGLARLGMDLQEPDPPMFIKIPLGRIERRSS